MTSFVNYFLNSKFSRLTQGHIKSEELYPRILNHDGKTAYCCYFDLDENLLKMEWDTGKVDNDNKKIYKYALRGQKVNATYSCNGPTFTDYEGMCRPALNLISFDFDSEDLNKSLSDVRRFVEWLDIEDVIIFFSGSKGFHVLVHFDYFAINATEHLPNQLKDLAKYLADFYPTLDTSIYNYNRKFRVPFTRHEKTDLYKIIISKEVLLNNDMDFIKNLARHRDTKDFMKEIIAPVENRKYLQVLTDALDESKRKSYVIEKDRAGTYEKSSPFEKFDNKLCIKKMLDSTCNDIGRNNAAIRIVNDYYRTGKPQATCEKDLAVWAANCGLPLKEVTSIITNIYERGQNYNYGCQDPEKAAYCSAKCSIWKKLDPGKRPMTVDQPNDQASGKMKTEFHGVTWLMENIFNSPYSEEKGVFESGLIVKQDASHLFYYKDNHWQYLDESKIHILKTKLNAHYYNKLSARKMDAVFKMFVLYVPEVPEGVDLFAPKNDMANFLDGTLHLKRNDLGEFELDFREHNKLDFCTTMIELNYSDYIKNKLQRNNKFEDWLFEFLEEEKEHFYLVQELFGASLMPKFPQFFVLIGKSGTGKSTTIKVLKQLHKNEKNICGVSPDKFHGFHMSSMVGKLINIVSDIKTNCRIDDDIVKQVDDQEVVRIEIKKKEDIYTKLPALHIFGANKMPMTSEGYSGAMKRRFSIINFNKVYQGKKNTEIAKDMFESDPVGILAFALRGLERLVLKNNGEYTKGEKSQDNVDVWTKKNDVLWQFLNEVVEDAIDLGGTLHQFKIADDLSVSRAILWKCFKKWQEDAIEQRNQIAQMSFLNMLNDAGFTAKRTNKGHFVFGIGELSEEADTSI